MKITFLRNAFMVAALVAGLSFTSCKKETTETTETTVVDGDTTSTSTVTSESTVVDEPATKDTISVTTDTVKVVKP